MVLVCLPLAAPIGLSPLHIPTLCGSEHVLVVSTEPLDDLSCLTTPGSGGGGLISHGPQDQWRSEITYVGDTASAPISHPLTPGSPASGPVRPLLGLPSSPSRRGAKDHCGGPELGGGDAWGQAHGIRIGWAWEWAGNPRGIPVAPGCRLNLSSCGHSDRHGTVNAKMA